MKSTRSHLHGDWPYIRLHAVSLIFAYVFVKRERGLGGEGREREREMNVAKMFVRAECLLLTYC